MTEVAFSSSFKRASKRRIKGNAVLEARFWERLETFRNNPFDQRLRTHKLSGRLKDLLELFDRVRLLLENST
jgi:mRNA-degrading endonuclease YafQ of YafQ-DinJ toxin-antitoxin module